jgi:hypothetical protein
MAQVGDVPWGHSRYSHFNCRTGWVPVWPSNRSGKMWQCVYDSGQDGDDRARQQRRNGRATRRVPARRQTASRSAHWNDGPSGLLPERFGFGLICSTEVQAKCVCQCINGRMRSVCSSPGDMVPANCPMSACPMTGPTVLPIQPPQLPPPGTSVCSQQQGRRVCR